MVLALIWLGVSVLVAFWSFAAWALYALTAWALSNAGALAGASGLVDALNLPQWIVPWLPPELVATVPAMSSALKPLVDALIGWAPAIAGGLSTLAWLAWAVGCTGIVALGLVASVLVVRYRGLPSRAAGIARLMPSKMYR